MEVLGRSRAIECLTRVAVVVGAALLASCARTGTEIDSAQRYVTPYGLGPDKWATAWLLTQHAYPGSKLIVVPQDNPLPVGTAFDLPSSQIKRIGNRSAFEVVKATLRGNDPTLDALAAIVHEIEVNFWSTSASPEAALVEEAFRSLQYRYGRDSVTPDCYVAFFERVYRLLHDSRSRAIPMSAERLQLSCEDLAQLSRADDPLVPEVPIVDVLSMAAAKRKVIFVDVREPDEYAEAHIPGAINVTLRDVRPNLRERFAGADYVVSYCVKDFRGFEMAKALAELGVPNSVIMRPYGIKGWVALGLPVSGATALNEEEARHAFEHCLENTAECLRAEAERI